MPAANATVVISVDVSGWMIVGETIFVTGAGYFTITNITGANITIKNYGIPTNASPGASIGLPATVSPGGVPGPVQPPLVNTIFVDTFVGSDTTGTGSINLPYQTISKALTTIPASPVGGNTTNSYQIMIAPGEYNEDLNFTAVATYVALIGFGGPWSLGTPSFGEGSLNTHNITWTFADTGFFGPLTQPRSGLAIGTMFTVGTEQLTVPKFITGATITGSIIILDNGGTGGGSNKEVYLNCNVLDQGSSGVSFNAAGGTSSPIGKCNVYAWRSRFASSFFGPPTGGGSGVHLQIADKCQFVGTCIIGNYSRLQNSLFNIGMTITNDGADINPSGMVDCWFTGAFTGPAGSARMDGNTYYWFTQNGATLAGGATITIQDLRLTPLKTIFSGVAGLQQTTNTGATEIGTMLFDPSSIYSGNAYTRVIKAIVELEVNTGGETATLVLYDITNGATIHTFTSTSTTPFTASVTLTVSSPGADTIANSSALYGWRLSRSGATASDPVTCKMAYLEVTYS